MLLYLVEFLIKVVSKGASGGLHALLTGVGDQAGAMVKRVLHITNQVEGSGRSDQSRPILGRFGGLPCFPLSNKASKRIFSMVRWYFASNTSLQYLGLPWILGCCVDAAERMRPLIFINESSGQWHR